MYIDSKISCAELSFFAQLVREINKALARYLHLHVAPDLGILKYTFVKQR